MGGSMYLYTLYDAKTGEYVAHGTAGQLAGRGYFPSVNAVAASWRSVQKTDKPRHWRMEREKLEPGKQEPKPNIQMRRVYIYTVYNAGGLMLGKGTAAELVAQGVVGNESTVHDIYRRGGMSEALGIARMTRKMVNRMVECKPRSKDKPGDVALRIRLKDPTPLQRDVRALIVYNKRAKKLGKPELSYGFWAVKGKPERPE